MPQKSHSAAQDDLSAGGRTGDNVDLVDTATASKILKRSEKTLIRWRRLRRGPPYVRIEDRVLYDRQRINGWIAKHVVEHDDA
ncbi:DNA-binding protein [Luteimonas aestuarii]|uniref:DNA-binding protein n=1 Tax=Luteimonas aestuarii TaxID=453837 RepID=A0A4R5TY68_9GAMM|nr:DNA-binding protein [Luteimonas aestuarii]TDK26174.1 DNA-binding protein [Luteimonas aestuarii]